MAIRLMLAALLAMAAVAAADGDIAAPTFVIGGGGELRARSIPSPPPPPTAAELAASDLARRASALVTDASSAFGAGAVSPLQLGAIAARAAALIPCPNGTLLFGYGAGGLQRAVLLANMKARSGMTESACSLAALVAAAAVKFAPDARKRGSVEELVGWRNVTASQLNVAQAVLLADGLPQITTDDAEVLAPQHTTIPASALSDLASSLMFLATGTTMSRVEPGLEELATVCAQAAETALAIDPLILEPSIVGGSIRRMLGQPDRAAALYQQIGHIYRPFPKPSAPYNVYLEVLESKRRPLLHRLGATTFRVQLASLVKLEHDAQQYRYLVSRGVLPHSYLAVAAEYEKLYGICRAAGNFSYIPVTDQYPLVQATYGANVYIRKSPAFRKPVLGQWSSRDAEQRYRDGFLVIDDFLTQEALEELLLFCEESVFWHDDGQKNSEERGYLGAYMFDGFSSGLLFQIVQELREKLPNVLGDHPLTQAWAYKYNSSQQGINLHADEAAVNLNFWITPDMHNLLPDSGGMVVHDLEAPYGWSFGDYNGNAVTVYKWLESAQIAKSYKVPYRRNRVVVFNSNLFHRTDHLLFRHGYNTRRINVTLLFGNRQPPANATSKGRPAGK